MWVLGTISCVLLSFLNLFFWYRTEPLMITTQIALVPLGQLMAANITDMVFFKGTRWEFTLNPGPFNVKDHVFYKKHITFFASLIVILTTQVLGFGWTGIFRREGQRLGDQNPILPNRLHLQLCILCLPRYLFKMLTSLSWICWIFPKSVLAQQLGSDLYGLGIGVIGMNWSTISSYLGSPLASPWFATANVAAGFILVMYVLTPTCYWLIVYSAKTFPIFSDGLFTSTGQEYNITSIVGPNFCLDVAAYDKQGPLYLSMFFAITYGVGFAALTATIVHVALFHGK
ncbi:Oligopeptide transporter 7 [Hibiscus syriacus]|uniref:Oligopeptide transporter 7 n=1 Tax=Hibiscus syriacus TaxID=106335 RepID=A0A6A3CWF8_HIBSY|nr:Oligopeptide transporter 7 [Hibiscus syriacus]